MVVEIQLNGAKKLRALGLDLKAMGDEGKGFRNEMRATIRVVARPLVAEIRQSARTTLPKKNGLAELVAKSSISVSTPLTGRKVGTRIVQRWKGGRKGWHDIEAFDAGTFRHPTRQRTSELKHANRVHWVEQSCNSGFFSKPLEGSTVKVQFALLRAMDVTAKQIAGK